MTKSAFHFGLLFCLFFQNGISLAEERSKSSPKEMIELRTQEGKERRSNILGYASLVFKHHQSETAETKRKIVELLIEEGVFDIEIQNKQNVKQLFGTALLEFENINKKGGDILILPLESPRNNSLERIAQGQPALWFFAFEFNTSEALSNVLASHGSISQYVQGKLRK